MAALSPVVSTALPVFTGVTGYLNTQDRLDQQAQRDAASQQLARQKLQLQQEKQASQSAAQSSDPAVLADRQRKAADQRQANQELQMQQLQDRQAQSTAAEDARIQTSMDQTVLAANDAEQTRRDALRQAVAKTTTSLAGQGVDPTDGSGEAILLGKVKTSDQQRQSADQATQLRLQALRQQADSLNQQNLLEQQQLADRQRLQWLNTFGG